MVEEASKFVVVIIGKGRIWKRLEREIGIGVAGPGNTNTACLF